MSNKTKLILAGLVAVLLIGLGYFLGYRNAPDKIVEKEKIVEKIVYKEREKTETETDVDVDENTNVHEKTVIEEKPDGSKVTTVIKDISTHTVTVVKEIEIQEKIVEVDVEKLVIKETIIENRNDWVASVKLGTNINQFRPSLTAPYFAPILVGVEVDRRIIGDVYVGVWALTDTTFNNIQGGLAVTYQF